MRKLLKFLLFLAVLGFIGLIGFAYLGDLTPQREDRRVPVTLDAQ